jgi:DNA-binding PadR family transcriptional regulator
VSPVFRHGRLRLYLLKLLDESPRHGYEVIRLLQDRFLGIYAPSPGTIYPRLARLEEDGLVTHEEVDGKKIYSITDKGREEIAARLSDLADLEDELTESLRDVAREISEDVRDTVRGIREEITSAFRSQQGERADDETASSGSASDDARRIRQEARRTREEMRAKFKAKGRDRGDWSSWQERFGRPDWTSWAGWSEWPGERGTDTASGRAGETGQRPGHGGGFGGSSPGGQHGGGFGGSSPGGQHGGGFGGSSPRGQHGGPNPFSDLERLAIQFATELRAAAKQAGTVGERSLNDLRDILTDTLAKVRVEVFSDDKPAEDLQTDQATEPGTEPGGSGADSHD